VLIERLLRNEAMLAEAAYGILTPDEQRALIAASGSARGAYRWSIADGVLVDEAHNFLDGPLRRYGHVVVDEAQDLSEMAFRVIGRRSPQRSLTILGDLAQSTTPGGQSSWASVFTALGSPDTYDLAHLTIGYRVPGPILERANRLLPSAMVDVPASRAARQDGHEAHEIRTTEGDLVAAVVREWRALTAEHPLTGVIVPANRLASLQAGLEQHDLTAVTRLERLGSHDVPLFAAEASKGLEFDAVIVVGEHEIADGTPRGSRLAYIALTRAVQRLSLVHVEP
jgi:DNA helicase IV